MDKDKISAMKRALSLNRANKSIARLIVDFPEEQNNPEIDRAFTELFETSIDLRYQRDLQKIDIETGHY